MRHGRLVALGTAALFIVVSVPLSALWPRLATRIASGLEEPAASVLRRTSPDVVWSDHDLDGRCEIVLANNTRRRVAPILAKTASLSPPIFVSLLVAALVPSVARRRLLSRPGLVRVVLAAVMLAVVEILVGWLAIGYVLAVENGRSPGVALRLATVAANAVRAFVPFVLVLGALGRDVWERAQTIWNGWTPRSTRVTRLIGQSRK